jgi:predicted dehydrogenase
MKKLMNVGFIGCGGHALGSGIPSVAANPDLTITAFCDLNHDRLTALQENYAPQYITKDFEEVFADPAIQMVICATKPDFRLPIMEAAVKYRKPLLVEKPMAYNKDDIFRMVSLMASSNVPFMVGFNRPHSPIMQAVRPIYRRNKNGNTLISYRIVGEAQIWPSEHYQAVCVKKESTVIHEVTHIFDLLHWLTGNEPESVFMAGGGHIDNVIVLSYPEEVTATIVAGDNGSVGYPKERLEINSNYGTLVAECFTELVVSGMGGDSGIKTFGYTCAGEEHLDGFVPLRDKLLKWRSELTEEKRRVGHYEDQIPSINKGQYEQYEYFRTRILSGEPIETDVIRGAIPTLTAWSAMESWNKKRVVSLDFSELHRAAKSARTL